MRERARPGGTGGRPPAAVFIALFVVFVGTFLLEMEALGQDLVRGASDVPSATATSRPPTTTAAPALVPGAATPSVVPSLTSTATPSPTSTATPTPSPTSSPTVSPTATATTARTPSPTVPTRPSATPAARFGVLQTSGAPSVVLRAAPRQSASALATLPVGTRVVVLGVVQGQAIDPGEPRWWHVLLPAPSGSATGYVYYKLLAVLPA